MQSALPAAARAGAAGLADDPQPAIPTAMTTAEMTPNALVTADCRLGGNRCERKTNPHWSVIPLVCVPQPIEAGRQRSLASAVLVS